MSYNKAYLRLEFTIGHVDKEIEIALWKEMRKLSETVCSSLAPNNIYIDWENKTWSVQKTRFELMYEEEHKDDVSKFFFKLKLKYPEFTEIARYQLTTRY